MKKHFCAAGADIIRHAMKAFFSFASFSCNKTLCDVNLRECFSFFQHNFPRLKYNAMKLMPFIIIGYHSVMPYVSPLLFTSKFMVGKINF